MRWQLGNALDPDTPLSTRRVRMASLGLTFAAHLGVLALLLIPATQPVKPRETSLMAFDVAPNIAIAKQAPAKPPQPVRVPPPPVEAIVVPPPIVPLPVPSDVVVAMLAQSEAQSQDGACDLTDPVRAALAESVEVTALLQRMPRAHRSVANAIMVWNVDWVASDNALDREALAVIRDVVAGTVAAASPECRLQQQGGPRLIMLPGVRENTVLALGSGLWRWQDMLQTARPDWSEEALLAAPRQELTLASADDASFRKDERSLTTAPKYSAMGPR